MNYVPVEDMILRDANKVRVEQGASADLLRRLQETQTLERFVDITKAMPDLDFEQILHVAANKDLKAVLKDLEVAEIPTNPHGINEKVGAKLFPFFLDSTLHPSQGCFSIAGLRCVALG